MRLNSDLQSNRLSEHTLLVVKIKKTTTCASITITFEAIKEKLKIFPMFDCERNKLYILLITEKKK